MRQLFHIVYNDTLVAKGLIINLSTAFKNSIYNQFFEIAV